MQIIWQRHTQPGQRGAGAAVDHGETTVLFVRLGSSHSTQRSACGLWGKQKKKDDTQPQSPVQNRIKPPPPTLVWTLQMARSQLENRLCFVKECTSPTRQVRVRGKRNHRSTHALTRPPLLSPVRAFSAG